MTGLCFWTYRQTVAGEMLSSYKHWQLFQRTWVRFPVPVLQLTTICSSRWEIQYLLLYSVDTRHTCGAQVHTQAKHDAQKISKYSKNKVIGSQTSLYLVHFAKPDFF